MDRLSNIVKQRLAAQQVPQAGHPSADTLTAFAEQGLEPPERQNVVSHLAVCADCRQAVALVGVMELASPPAQPRRSPIARFPAALRWASVAALFAVAIGIGLLGHEHQNRPQMAVSTPAPALQKAPPPAVQPRTEPNPKSENNQMAAVRSRPGHSSRSGEVLPAYAFAVKPERKKAQPGSVVGGIIADSRSKTAFETAEVADGVMTSNGAPPPVPEPPASAGIKASTLSDVASAPRAAGIGLPVSSAHPPLAASSSAQSVEVGSASKATRRELNGRERASFQQQPASAAANKALASSAIGGPIGGGAIHGLPPIARWTISPNGNLQRRATDGNFASIAPAPGVLIRAVAAQGIEVWAAGSQPDPSAKQGPQSPVLFHSSDAGETWLRIEGPWDSPITALSLSGTNTLTVITVNGSWSTADAGKSWTKK